MGQSTSRYLQVAQVLGDEIAKGRWPVGGLMPTEAELCERFSMSRYTARAALQRLQEQGLVTRLHGVGTRVVSSAPNSMYFLTPNSIDDLIQYAELTALVDHRITQSAQSVFADLDGGQVDSKRPVRIEAIRVVADPKSRGMPIAWTEIFIIEEYAAIVESLDEIRGALGAEIERRFGESITEIRQDIDAVSIPDFIAEKLGVAAGSPGLRVRRAYVGRNGKVFEAATSVHRAGSFRISARLRRTG